jgi:excisionase family DNA binding protein
VLPQTFTVNEFLNTFKVGRTKAYEEIQTGRLATYKLGRKRLISAHAAEAWQRRLEAETTAAIEQVSV